MPDYDPTSPKVSDDFIAQDGEADVQGHIYKNEDDARTESRPEGFYAKAAPEESDDVEGHLRVLAVPGEDADSILARADEFRAAAAPDDAEDVEGHLGARHLGPIVADDEVEGFVAKSAAPDPDEFRAAF